MEDENGLELSLGLSCGGLSAKSKVKNGSSSDLRTEEGDRANNIVDDLKNFLHAGTQKQDSSNGSQRSDSVKPQENFFNDLSKVNVEADASVNLNGRGGQVAYSNKSAEMEEEKRQEAGNKRKMLFDDMNHQKKHERDAHHSDLHEKKRTSFISITTEDGSTAENEDVAESEVEGSTSRLVSQHDDGSKRFIGVGSSSEVPKEVHGFADSSAVDLNGQKRFNGSSENEFKIGSLTYNVPFSIQSVNMNVPYSLPGKESNTVGAPSQSGHPPPGMMQVMPSASGDRSGTQPVNSGNLPLMFGYSPVQLPMLDKSNSRGMVSHPQQFHPSYAGRGPPNSVATHVIPHNSSDATQYDGRPLEWAKGDVKQHGTEEGSSSLAEEDVKGSSTNLRAKDAPDRLTTDGLSLDFSAIKPGIDAEADVKFGGCGSYPNLPWVSTTGQGPNGRTISGVTYRYNTNQIKIVCACHGSHMSPEEFVRHASEEHVNPESGTSLPTLPSNNPAASAQS